MKRFKSNAFSQGTVLAFILSSNLALAEEKLLSCVLDRLQITGLVEMDTTDVSKFEEPLIRIDGNGEFWVYVGNQYDEQVFPDGIHRDFVGKPSLPTDNVYRWTHSAYSKVSGNDVVTDWTFSLTRDELMLRKSREEDLRAFGMPNGRHVWTYKCRLIEKVDFEKFKLEMSERYMTLNAEERRKEEEKESRRKI